MDSKNRTYYLLKKPCRPIHQEKLLPQQTEGRDYINKVL